MQTTAIICDETIGFQSAPSGIELRQNLFEEKKQAKMQQLEAEMYRDLTFHPQIYGKYSKKQKDVKKEVDHEKGKSNLLDLK